MALCSLRGQRGEALSVHIWVAGSNCSVLVVAGVWSVAVQRSPPTTSRWPVGSRVALWPERAFRSGGVLCQLYSAGQ
ncbi:MAG: hypothetical protein ACKO9F_21350 [Caldilinea sp.]